MWWSIVGLGGSCFVTSTDKKTALKGYQVWEGGVLRAMCEHNSEKVLAREALVYKHLGEHPHILRCFGLEEVHPGVHSLRVEYAPLGEVRSFIENRGDAPLGEHVRLRMALDVALGMSHVHRMGVQHCDMTCRNLFIFGDYRVKIGDFGGSLIAGNDELGPLVYEASAYELPRRGRKFEHRPARQRELFALGSAIYEITAWGEPCAGMEDDDIERNYAAEVFPSLEGVPAAHIIRKCWDEKYASADEIVEELDALVGSKK
ncbi:putative TKL protein kinase [Rosellinia necatrix]|uniref:EKC/KEOPS complex subunit BUD32 n=1 Tax=Rosellinia necatrix TaxID=77044 RepID=A0A1W2TVK2_ROSNE|nr:putative TKL protein kinase [Rosellinia necatrix]